MEPYFGQSTPKLGFGLMRLPKLADGKIDIEQTKKMVDLFMSAGLTYFDTAYVYDSGDSEKAAKAALVDRYPRESYTLATKLSAHPAAQLGGQGKALPGIAVHQSRLCRLLRIAAVVDIGGVKIGQPSGHE